MNVDRLELRRIALATMIMVTSVVHRSCSRGLTHARAKHAPLENKYSVLEHMALRANFRGQYLEKFPRGRGGGPAADAPCVRRGGVNEL